MPSPLVSVIVPAYNSSMYIKETLVSVLNQTFADFELIVIDDGSTDGQREVILQACQDDPRLRYVYKPNAGVSGARNTGFNFSVGSYVAFLDADDVWLPNNLEIKLSKFQSGDYGLVHSDGLLINEDTAPLPGRMTGREGQLLTDMLKWKATQVPGPSSILVKREVLQTIGLFDTHLSTSADHDFFLRVASKYPIGRVAEITWMYRMHPANMHRNISVMERDVLFVYRKASANKLFTGNWMERKCYANMYLILAASWAGDGNNKWRGVYFTLRALGRHPNAILNITKRFWKRWF